VRAEKVRMGVDKLYRLSYHPPINAAHTPEPPMTFAAAVLHAHSVVTRRHGEASANDYLFDAINAQAVVARNEDGELQVVWPDGSRLETTDGLLVEVL